MLRRMLGVVTWLDVASLENVEEDHSFLFLKKNSMKFFFFFENLNFSKELKFLKFFFFNLEILNFFKELKILIGDFFFFFLKQPKKYESNALSPKALFENFIFLFFWNIWKSWIFSWNWKFWLIFFFFEKFRNLEFFQGIENFEFFFFLKET